MQSRKVHSLTRAIGGLVYYFFTNQTMRLREIKTRARKNSCLIQHNSLVPMLPKCLQLLLWFLSPCQNEDSLPYQCNSLDANCCSLKKYLTVGCCTPSTENRTALILSHPCKVNSTMLECNLVCKNELTHVLFPSCNHIQQIIYYSITKASSSNMHVVWD